MLKNSSIVGDGKKQAISSILYQLEMNLEKFISEVQKSYALYDIGEKTALVKDIEKSLKENPVDSLLGLSKNIDDQILFFINTETEKFFKLRNDVISSVYKLKTEKRLELYYLIVLKDDNISNRQSVFSFLDEYDIKPVANKYPINFKFSSEDLLSGFYIERKIEL